MNIKDWCYVLRHFGSVRSEKEIVDRIKTECLIPSKRNYNGYRVNTQKVWVNLVLTEADCLYQMKRQDITNSKELEAWYQAIGYRNKCWEDMREKRKISCKGCKEKFFKEEMREINGGLHCAMCFMKAIYAPYYDEI